LPQLDGNTLRSTRAQLPRVHVCTKGNTSNIETIRIKVFGKIQSVWRILRLLDFGLFMLYPSLMRWKYLPVGGTGLHYSDDDCLSIALFFLCMLNKFLSTNRSSLSTTRGTPLRRRCLRPSDIPIGEHNNTSILLIWPKNRSKGGLVKRRRSRESKPRVFYQ
jgi:hypothetical protein